MLWIVLYNMYYCTRKKIATGFRHITKVDSLLPVVMLLKDIRKAKSILRHTG